MGERSPSSVIAIFGPTAAGKSEVAEALTERIPAELVSADAMQLYRGLPILTNQSSFPTHLVGLWPLSHEASVGEYGKIAHATIDAILARGRTAIVVGGTGLYLRAALADLDLPPPASPELRGRCERLYERLGAERAHALLAERDPAAAAATHANDRRRVVRSLELAEAGFSLARTRNRLWSDDLRHPALVIGLDVPKEVLARRIEERTRSMFERGVEEEVRRALAGRISATARHAHGLREIAELPREEAVEQLLAKTRRYAVYQRKWMRRIPGLVTVPGGRPAGEVADDVLEVARARKHVPARRAG